MVTLIMSACALPTKLNVIAPSELLEPNFKPYVPGNIFVMSLTDSNKVLVLTYVAMLLLVIFVPLSEPLTNSTLYSPPTPSLLETVMPL